MFLSTSQGRSGNSHGILIHVLDDSCIYNELSPKGNTSIMESYNILCFMIELLTTPCHPPAATINMDHDYSSSRSLLTLH